VPIKRSVAPTLLVVLGLGLLVQLSLAIAARADGYDFLDPVIEVRRILLEDAVRPPDEARMREAVLEAMVSSLDDPHAAYVPPDLEQAFEKDLRGIYVGIGAEVNMVDGAFTIVSPLEDSPALEAGVRPGDVVLEIDGRPTAGLDADQCIERLLGEPGTTVTVRVRHRDGSEETLSIVRRRIVTRTVEGLRRAGERWLHCVDDRLGIQYVRIEQFQDETPFELRRTLDGLRNDGLNALVLDLRDDPGGALPAAVDVADLFLERGIIVSVRGRDGGEDRRYDAVEEGTLPRFPMVVIVNERSASASEIVAGALQENDRAIILGTRTFGKGSVQDVRRLPFDYGTLKFTSALYHLPSGRNIDRAAGSSTWGVDPDPGFVVPVSDEDYFEMLQNRRAYEIIDVDGPRTDRCVNEAWVRQTLGDRALAEAIDALEVRLTEGRWPTRTTEDAGVIAMEDELADAMARHLALLEEVRASARRLEELRGAAAETGYVPLLPEDVELEGGTLRDRWGNPVGAFEIAGGDVELALSSLRLDPIVERVIELPADAPLRSSDEPAP